VGNLEKKVREQLRNTRLQRTVLSAIESLSDLTTGMLAGSIYKMYKMMDRRERRKKYRSVLVARNRLEKHGLIKRHGKFMKLTPKGEKKLSEWKRLEYIVPRPLKWDGKWRVLIFDIPERQRELRDKVRNTLKTVGFKQLQQSVWIYPFDCEDFITLLKMDFKIGKNLLYLVAEALEYDRHLRDYFEVYTN